MPFKKQTKIIIKKNILIHENEKIKFLFKYAEINEI